MHQLSLSELSEALKTKKFSSVELTNHFLNRIDKYDAHLNSFITIDPEGALQAAEKADQAIANHSAGPLTGIPIAHKDIFCTNGVRTSCGSRMLDNFVPPYSATVVDKLTEAGMVMLGKTNMDEYAMGSSNETSFYGPTKNPWNTSKVPGGSSGGSAAAVAARLTPVATGTDTGGSIRQPAALCGITGLKPTYGRISRWGMVAFASSLDQAGPMATSAADCALLLESMAGLDLKDSTCADTPVPKYTETLHQEIRGLKIGLPKEYFTSGLSSTVHSAIEQTIRILTEMGAEIVEVSLPNTNLAVPAYYIIAPAECSSNLSRFDGVRYGHRCSDPDDLHDLYGRSRAEGFGREVKRRILIGTYALSAGYYDAYYLKAQKIRRLISNDFQTAFEQVDFILGPTTPTVAFDIGSKSKDPVSMYLSDIYTIATNLAGLPGLSMPAGFSESGLPIGAQIIGNYFDEGRMLALAHQFQQATSWHQQMPSAYND